MDSLLEDYETALKERNDGRERIKKLIEAKDELMLKVTSIICREVIFNLNPFFKKIIILLFRQRMTL